MYVYINDFFQINKLNWVELVGSMVIGFQIVSGQTWIKYDLFKHIVFVFQYVDKLFKCVMFGFAFLSL